MLTGTGFYIWRLDRCAPNVPTLIERIKQSKIQHVLVKIADGENDYPGTQKGEALLKEALPALKQVLPSVWGWTAIFGEGKAPVKPIPPEAQAQKFAERLKTLGLEGGVIDAENFPSVVNGKRHPRKWTVDGAKRFMAALHSELDRLGIGQTPLALSTYRFPILNGSFPVREFLEGCQIAMPQVYWIDSEPIPNLERSLREYKTFLGDKLFIPTGIAAPADATDWLPTPEQITQFCERARSLGLPVMNFWSFQHAFSKPEIWKAVTEQAKKSMNRGEKANPLAELTIQPLSDTATVTAESVAYYAAPTVIDQQPAGNLQQGQKLSVMGWVDTAGEFGTWLRFTRGRSNRAFWLPARFATLESSRGALVRSMTERRPRKTLRFARRVLPGERTVSRGSVSISELTATLSRSGIHLADDVILDPEEASNLVDLLAAYPLMLKGKWTQADLRRLKTHITLLQTHAISLTTINGSAWSLGELDVIVTAIEHVAAHTLEQFQAVFNNSVLDPAFAFRVLYAPLTLKRVDADNLSLVAGEIWWAVNSDGYHVRFGNLVFSSKGHLRTIGKLTRSKFEPEELVIHELAHAINWRYTISDQHGATAAPEVLYQDDGAILLRAENSPTAADMIITLPNPDSGFTVSPRSSNKSWETVTDLIVNDILDSFSIDTEGQDLFNDQLELQGRVRKQQAADLLHPLVKARVKSFHALGKVGQSAGLDAAISLRNQFLDADIRLCQTLAEEN